MSANEDDLATAAEFCSAFEWLYDVKIPRPRLRELCAVLLEAVADTNARDRKGAMLLAYGIHLNDVIRVVPAPEREALRATLKQVMQHEMSRYRRDSSGALWRTIHNAIEEQEPGSTGVRLSTIRPVPTWATKDEPADPASAPQTPQRRSTHHRQAEPGPRASSEPGPFQNTMPTAPPQGWAPPSEPWVRSGPPPISHVGGHHGGFHPGGIPGGGLDGGGSVLQQQARMHRETQRALLESQLSKAMHNTTMSIIRNIG